MNYKIVRLSERETNEVSKVYGLWDFVTECLNGEIVIFVYEG